MIKNGIYLATTRFLDGVEAYNRHVMVLRDGTMRGGGGFYYTVGSYTCSGGTWKGEMTSREHSPIDGTYPWARKDISVGFTGTGIGAITATPPTNAWQQYQVAAPNGTTGFGDTSAVDEYPGDAGLHGVKPYAISTGVTFAPFASSAETSCGFGVPYSCTPTRRP